VTSLLLETTDQWTQAIDNGKMIDIIYFDLKKAFDKMMLVVNIGHYMYIGYYIYFDLKKAFDKINIHLLLKKLENIGLTGLSLSWISNFLLDRSVCVKIGTTISRL
jgi:hypothetical protein